MFVCVHVFVCVFMCVCVCVCVQVVRLTWTLLDAEGSVSVLGPGVVFQLEGGGVVDKRLGALGHACPTVIEVGAGLQIHTSIAHTVVEQVWLRK